MWLLCLCWLFGGCWCRLCIICCLVCWVCVFVLIVVLVLVGGVEGVDIMLFFVIVLELLMDIICFFWFVSGLWDDEIVL